MANCGPCLALGLQVVAHYDADARSGKEAECYYHHWQQPLPQVLQDKIAKPAAAEMPAEPAQPEKKRPEHGARNARFGLNPDVCHDCWKKGHVCKPHCDVDGVRLCIDCADGLPCAYDRDREKNPRTPAHERYHVKLPGVKKPQQPTTTAGAAAIQDAVREPQPVVPVQTAGKDRQKEKERPPVKPTNNEEIPRYCGREGCTKKLTRGNKSGFCSKHFYDSKRKSDNAPAAPRAARATPPPQIDFQTRAGDRRSHADGHRKTPRRILVAAFPGRENQPLSAAA